MLCARGHKDFAVVVMRENESTMAKKVEDVHSIHHVAPASAAPPGDLSITTPHVKNSGAVYPKIPTGLTVTFQPSHFSYAQI